MTKFTYGGQDYYIPSELLPLLAITVAGLSFLIPLLAFWFQRRGAILPLTQRRVEVVWLVGLSLFACTSLSVWIIDMRSRTTSVLLDSLFYGYNVLTLLVSLIVPAICRWRDGKSFAVRPLLKALVWAAIRIATFYPTIFVVIFLSLGFVRGGPLIFLAEEWIFSTMVVAAVVHSMGPWAAKCCWTNMVQFVRDVRDLEQREQELIERLRTEPQPVLMLAQQKIRSIVARRYGQASADDIEMNADPANLVVVSPRVWLVRGWVRLPDSPGQAWSVFPWRASITIGSGELRSNFAEIAWNEQIRESLRFE